MTTHKYRVSEHARNGTEHYAYCYNKPSEAIGYLQSFRAWQSTHPQYATMYVCINGKRVNPNHTLNTVTSNLNPN